MKVEFIKQSRVLSCVEICRIVGELFFFDCVISAGLFKIFTGVCVCVCTRARVRERECVCVCVCVRERERERERESFAVERTMKSHSVPPLLSFSSPLPPPPPNSQSVTRSVSRQTVAVNLASGPSPGNGKNYHTAALSPSPFLLRSF